jgi:hypothetical protein
MKTKLANALASLLIVMVLFACNQEKKQEGYVVNGTIEGITDGTLLVLKHVNDREPEKHPIKDGKFTLKGGPVSEPTNILLAVEEGDMRFGFYVENGVTTYVGKVYTDPKWNHKSIQDVSFEGSIVNQHEAEVRKLEAKLREKYNTFEAPADERDAMIAKSREESNEICRNFIKENPGAFYSAHLVLRLAHGQDLAAVKKLQSMLDPKMDNSKVRALKTKIKDMELTDVDPSEIIKAKNVAYKVSGNFNGKTHTNVKYLGMMSNDNVCALNDAGEVKIIDSKGKEVKKFKPELPSKASTIAVDKKDNIYVMYPLTKKVTRKFRGRTMEVEEVYGFEAAVFNAKGKQQRKLELKGLKTATGARIANGKLLIADWQNKIIGVFNTETGAKEAALEDMRPCCAILDFAVNAKNEVLVANLGAFRVQAFDLTGKNLLAFGKRGKGVSDFHGCCNPVGVAYLNNGAIVTVEKDPTRVKVFSSEGAKTIAGIDELVKGCSYIPMIVDSKDNLYLASPAKGMIKCVSI